MRILSSRDLEGLLSPRELLAEIETALRLYAEGGAVPPDRGHVEFGANTLLTMPAVAGDFVGVKLATVVPDNATRQLPVTNGLMTLLDARSGVPLAASAAVRAGVSRSVLRSKTTSLSDRGE